ncbi:MAG: bifunctional UDP-sugar hydrolase/5'-nucleotidase [Oscillospiraceae bacterium]|nr:bifunctional UDP-sugar hydrolase/5'-nucleotidase [Oscillospiraceae bacterium]
MPKVKKLTLLHSNDMHGDFLAEKLDERLVGGVSMLSGYINSVRKTESNVIYAIAGDMFKGSVIDTEFRGISTIEIMNMLAPDVATLGNHEIDYGIAHLLFLEKCAKFPIINANLFIRTNHVRLFTPYTVIEKDGLNIMFIGVITEEILAQTKNEALIGSFVDVRAAAKEVGIICDNYKTTKIDYTVLLTHIGIEKDKELAALIDKNWRIDLIVGGHSHTFLEEPVVVNGIPIVQAGTGTDQIGRMDLTFDTDTRKVLSQHWRSVPIDAAHCPTDPVLEDVLLRYKNQTDQKYARIIATLARKLTHPSRTEETELGDLFADLLQVDSSFDIMLYGSGSIRKEELGPIVQYQDLQECCPYDDPMYMLEVTGAQLRRMVAFVLREEAFGGHTEFYQYSRGVRFVWSRSQQKFLEFKLNGEDIADDRRIRIALQKYHFCNFDDFFGVPLAEVEQNHRARVVATSCCCIFEELLANSNHLDAHVEGRLVIEP